MESLRTSVDHLERMGNLTDPKLEIGRMTRQLVNRQPGGMAQCLDQRLDDVFDVRDLK